MPCARYELFMRVVGDERGLSLSTVAERVEARNTSETYSVPMQTSQALSSSSQKLVPEVGTRRCSWVHCRHRQHRATAFDCMYEKKRPRHDFPLGSSSTRTSNGAERWGIVLDRCDIAARVRVVRRSHRSSAVDNQVLVIRRKPQNDSVALGEYRYVDDRSLDGA